MTGFDSKRQASRDLLEQALDALLCCYPDTKVGAALQIKTVADLRAELAQPAVAEPNEWRAAIDDELVCLHLGTADSFPTAKFALDLLISWHVSVALDPEVSSSAQALIDRGAAVAEPLSAERVNAILMVQPGMLTQEWFFAFARAVEQAHGIKEKP